MPRDAWAVTCERARQRSINIINQRHDLTERCVHAARLLRSEGEDAVARMRARTEEGASERAEGELKLVYALATGLTEPKIDVDAAGVVILSSEPIPAEELR